jgi:hypothetical protein
MRHFAPDCEVSSWLRIERIERSRKSESGLPRPKKVFFGVATHDADGE